MAGDFAKFRERVKAREHVLGTFLKLPTTQVIEILGVVGFDFVVIDQEHAALDRLTTDVMILAGRASGVAAVVRVNEGNDAQILSALDSGAAGVMVPHVDSVEKARSVARSCRYAGGTRGFAGLSRAARWGSLPGPAHMKAADAGVICIAMIEDVHAVEHVPEIARIEGIDAIFIGRGDLTASFGDDPQAKSKVAALVEKIAAATREAGLPLLMLATDKADLAEMKRIGASAFLYSSDHAFIKAAATAALKEYRAGGSGSMIITEERLRITHELEALLADYWHEVDTNWGRRAAEFYTEDAVFEGSEHSYRGRAKINEFYQYRINRGERVAVHAITNFRAVPESPTKAVSSWYLFLYAHDGVPVLPTAPPIQIALMTDHCVRDASGAWKYSHRKFGALFKGGVPTTSPNLG